MFKKINDWNVKPRKGFRPAASLTPADCLLYLASATRTMKLGTIT